MKKILPTSIPPGINKKGFTLVELLITVTIIAILSVIGIVVFTGIQRNARDSRRVADINAIANALEVHYNTTLNQYCTGAAGTYCAPAASWFSANVISLDPGTAASYGGLPANGAATYTVCTISKEVGNQYCRSNQQ